LEPILDRFQTHKWRDILIGIQNGRLKLWVFERSCGVTEIADYPARRVLVLMLAAGDLDEILSKEDELTEFARSHGCEALHVYGRPGWSRVAKHFKMASITLTKEV
jgi:hypothetical protein